MRPARSRTNRRPDPSPASPTKTGWFSPDATSWKVRVETRSEGLAGVGDAGGVALAATVAMGDAVVLGVAVAGPIAVGLGVFEAVGVRVSVALGAVVDVAVGVHVALGVSDGVDVRVGV
jgi:hypothetical protein